MKNPAIKIKERNYTFSDLVELTGIRAYQTASGVNIAEPDPLIQSRHGSEVGQKRGRFWQFLARKLACNAYVRRAVEKEVTLSALKTSLPPKFFFGLGLVLFSYGIRMAYDRLCLPFCWPISRSPALLMLGPAFYGFSDLVWIFGMYLAGRDCIKYANIMLSWGLRKGVEKAVFTKRS